MWCPGGQKWKVCRYPGLCRCTSQRVHRQPPVRRLSASTRAGRNWVSLTQGWQCHPGLQGGCLPPVPLFDRWQQALASPMHEAVAAAGAYLDHPGLRPSCCLHRSLQCLPWQELSRLLLYCQRLLTLLPVSQGSQFRRSACVRRNPRLWLPHPRISRQYPSPASSKPGLDWPLPSLLGRGLSNRPPQAPGRDRPALQNTHSS